MNRGRRAVGIPLTVVVALLAALLLAPSGGTHALWSDGKTRSLGAVSSDNIGLSARLVSAEPTLPGASRIEVQNTSASLQGSVSATPSVAPVGWDNGLAGQVAVSYAECAGGAGIGTSPVGPGERQELCVQTTAPGSGAAFLRQYAGVTVQVSSALTQTAVGVPTWSSSATVGTQHRVPFPRPTHPGDTLELANVCREPLLVGSATLSWAWPDTTGTVAQQTPAVATWAIQKRVGPDAWQGVVSGISGSARSARLSTADLLSLGSYDVRIVGYSAADPATPVVATFTVNVTSLNLLGTGLLVRCNSATGPL
ncbi:hypothetical protein [Ornithinimicrobium murale]|uniref:hypothetical protein n=1 Tax=Ornithinimicrobium murale TaxID=1050153 RepID=UPI0013B4617A|nr:hypothetical protein [Ornithinimicrobium murale]